MKGIYKADRLYREIGRYDHALGRPLDINYHHHIAQINQDKCIHCGLCYIACEDTSHQSINIEKGNPL